MLQKTKLGRKDKINGYIFPDELKFILGKEKAAGDTLKDILTHGRDITTIRDNNDLANFLITKINAITGAERGAIFLLKPGTSRRVFTLRASKI